MKAMVLAAGLGTRLRPLTDDRPKALVEVAGRTMLEITLTRLLSFGIQDVIINVHHFADLVLQYLKAHDNFGMRIAVSEEQVLLDTGGGLKKAGLLLYREFQPRAIHPAQRGRHQHDRSRSHGAISQRTQSARDLGSAKARDVPLPAFRRTA